MWKKYMKSHKISGERQKWREKGKNHEKKTASSQMVNVNLCAFLSIFYKLCSVCSYVVHFVVSLNAFDIYYLKFET